ncbi:MAG: hypothetical protein AABW67_02630 [Nanoarchaeota archaeon]
MGYKDKNKLKEYQREHYQKNRDRIRARHKENYLDNRDKTILHRKELYQKRRKDFLLTYKLNKKCSLCDYNKHPEILQFHHKDKYKKNFTIGNLELHKRNSLEFKKEIDKCILLCPNCHSLLHWKVRKEEVIK